MNSYNPPPHDGWSTPPANPSSGAPYDPTAQQPPYDPNAAPAPYPSTQPAGYPATGGYAPGGYGSGDAYPAAGAPDQGYAAAQYQQAYGYGGYPGGEPPRRGPRPALIGGVIAAVLLLIALGITGFILVTKDDDSGDDKASSKDTDKKSDKKSDDGKDSDGKSDDLVPTSAPYNFDAPSDFETIETPSALQIPGIDITTSLGREGRDDEVIAVGHMATGGSSSTYLSSFRSSFSSLGTPQDTTVDGHEGFKVESTSGGAVYVFANEKYVVLIASNWLDEDAGEKALETVVDSFEFK